MSGRPSLPGVASEVAIDNAVRTTSATFELSWAELIHPRHRAELDRTVRAVAIALDVDYVVALEKLERWRATVGGRSATLLEVIHASPVGLNQMVDHVFTLAEPGGLNAHPELATRDRGRRVSGWGRRE